MNRPVNVLPEARIASLALMLLLAAGCNGGDERAPASNPAPGAAGAAAQARGPAGEPLREDLAPRFAEARKLLRYNRRNKARSLLQDLVREQPGCAALHFTLGLAFRSRRMRAQSLQVFTNLTRRFSGSPLGEIGLALLAADDGRVEDAQAHIERARRTGVPDPWLDLVTGMTAMLGGEDDRALDAFRRATEADPLLTEAWTNQGLLLARRGATADAEAALHGALRAHPYDLAALNQLALLLAREGRADEARQYRAQHDRLSLVADLSLAPPGTTPTARRKLAAHYIYTGQIEKALAELDALLQDEPGDAEARAEAARLRRVLAERDG